MSTEILEQVFVKLSQQQRWALKACTRPDMPESVSGYILSLGLFRPTRYSFGTHNLDLAKTEDTYSSDKEIVVSDFPKEVWFQVVKKACESYKRESLNKLEFIIAKAECDVKILKRTETSEIIEKMPGEPYYNGLFSS